MKDAKIKDLTAIEIVTGPGVGIAWFNPTPDTLRVFIGPQVANAPDEAKYTSVEPCCTTWIYFDGDKIPE